MFENYNSNVQVGHNCECHTSSQNTPEQYTPAKVMKDELGNITKLQWAPDARFTINLTSDTNISIVEGSQILNKPGLTPLNNSGHEGLYAYNTVDMICWQFCQGSWKRLPNIITSSNNTVVITFGNDQATTKLSIKNFRGETIFSDTEKGNFIPLTIDDNLANTLMQGFYNVDIYQITSSSTKLIRRIPLSVSNSQVQNNPTTSQPSSCHTNKGFATDNTLSLRNGVLSVNVSEECYPGGTLPISSNAVFEYAQPRTIYVDVDLNTNSATIGANDVYNYSNAGGDVTCIVKGRYLSLIECDINNATFKELLLDDNTILSYIITIDNAGNVIHYSESSAPINAVADIEQFKELLSQQMQDLDVQHDADISRMDSSIESMNTIIRSMQDQIGDLKVTEKIVELYNNYNRLNSKMNELDEEVDSKLEESDMETIVSEKVSEELTGEKLQDYINNAVNENIKLDGGVVE